MINQKHIKSINLDENTIQKMDEYAKQHALSRSSVVRLALNIFLREAND
jgi:metal-responsive CopG/Arc/MetJ family transcriptional regulator